MCPAPCPPALTIDEWWQEHYSPAIGFGKELALAKVLGSMLFPNPKHSDRRVGFVVNFIATRIESWDATHETRSWAEVAKRHMSLGFLTLLINHPRPPVQEDRHSAWDHAERRGLVAGEMLRLTKRLVAQGYAGTLEQALCILMRRFAQERREGKSRQKLLDVWHDYRTVAPLWAAVLVYEDGLAEVSHGEVPRQDMPTVCLQHMLQHLPHFLGAAGWFRQFGTSHIPRTKNQKRPLLDPEETWISAEGLAEVVISRVLLPPLTPQERAWLEKHR
jgi:hypothetical protein